MTSLLWTPHGRGGHLEYCWILSAKEGLTTARQCRLQQAFVAQTRRTAVENQKPRVDRIHEVLVYPKRFLHFASARRASRQLMMSSAFAIFLAKFGS
jgi:hypothetical protein